MKAPVCRNCGKAEWRHVCQPKSGAADAAPGVTVAVTHKKSVTPAVTYGPGGEVVVPAGVTVMIGEGELPPKRKLVAGECCPTCGKPVGRSAAQRKAAERARKKAGGGA